MSLLIIKVNIPCCPTINSRNKLVKPKQITGVISTPPIGFMNFLNSFKNGSVGIAIICQKPLLRLIFGYQLRIILIKKARVKAPSNNEEIDLIIGR